jgi:hypothetical protein
MQSSVKRPMLFLKHLFAHHLVAILLLYPALGNARQPQLSDTSITRGKTPAGFHYMNGGLTFDEQQAMERKSGPYNLKLVFASRLRSLASPILLLIGNNHSGRVDKIMVRGPRFYIRLPPGGYTIAARIKNKFVLIRDVYLHADRRATCFVRGY